MPRKLTKEEFVAKAVAVHGERYDYSETEYLPMPHKITIRCPEHGVFMQKAGQHLIGKGCLQCANGVKWRAMTSANRKWTTESFRARAAELNPALDFSKAKWSTERDATATVVCPIHGEYQAGLFRILSGSGCKKCFHDGQLGRATAGREHQLKRFRIRHGDRYDYSLAVGEWLADEKIPIACPAHGVFHQAPTQHAAGAGCPRCFRDSLRGPALDKAVYLARFRNTHGGRYNYSLLPSSFMAKDKIIIVCPLHGMFEQEAHSHGAGAGCRKCRWEAVRVRGGGKMGWGRSDWTEKQKGRLAILYLLKLTDGQEAFYKIGITFRLRQRCLSIPYLVEVVGTWGSPDAGRIWDAEKVCKCELKRFQYQPLKPFDGQMECFHPDQAIMDTMNKLGLPRGIETNMHIIAGARSRPRKRLAA